MSSLTNAKSIKWLIKLKNYPGLQSLLIAFFFNIVKKGKFVEQIYAMQTIYVNHANVTHLGRYKLLPKFEIFNNKESLNKDVFLNHN